jgi:predicted DsbA family dithiol-disulfide isomerase
MGPSPVFFFDYLDPLSYLQERELRSLADTPGLPRIRRVPVELRPPPVPLLDPDGPEWRDRWSRARREANALGIALAEPPILFWTRKAHELVLHAAARGLEDAVHRALFDAVFVEGRDIGRIDVLVSLGREAERSGVAEPPAVALGAETLRGFHNRDALRTLLFR